MSWLVLLPQRLILEVVPARLGDCASFLLATGQPPVSRERELALAFCRTALEGIALTMFNLNAFYMSVEACPHFRLTRNRREFIAMLSAVSAALALASIFV